MINSRQRAAAIAVLALWLPSCGPSSAENKVRQTIERLGGTVILDALHKKHIVLVELSRTKAGDAELKELADLKQLGVLLLQQTPITDAGLAEISRCKKLEHLGLG